MTNDNSFYSPYPHYVMLRFAQDDNRNIAGYKNVTREVGGGMGVGRWAK